MPESAKSDVFVDLSTQREFLHPTGACRVANAEEVVRNLKHLVAFVRWAHLPVISCVDIRRPNQIDDQMPLSPGNESPDERKLGFTLLPQRVLIESDNCLCVSLDILRQQQQAIFTKYHRDPFTNPKLDRLFTELPARRFVLFGVPLETSLRILALGLHRRNRKVLIVEDACGYWSREEASMVLRQLSVKSCEIITTRRLIETAFSAHDVRRQRERDHRSVA